MTDAVIVGPDAPVSELRAALDSGRSVVIGDGTKGWVHERLLGALGAPGVGSSSPVPVDSQPVPRAYEIHPASPPPPSVALPCRTMCAFGGTALSSLPPAVDDPDTMEELIVRTAERLLQHGWRHVATPGLALAWDAADASHIDPIAGWNARSLASLVGPANSGLEAHCSWAKSRCDDIRVVIDGACLTAEPYTGTQHLVVEVTRWLSITRPSARVLLAVPRAHMSQVAHALSDSRVTVVERSTDLAADVVYRPYQMLFAGELDFVLGVGRRGLVGQLDMIGFSNPFYHPSDQLFYFARNLQRHLMRVLDGVTFISEFGRDSAFVECPDLDPERLHVVSCGSDPRTQQGELGSGRTLRSDTPFLVCLSSTFWHKNRAHAVATFAALVSEHGYLGHLVIGGPEPYFGRSTRAEEQLMAQMPPDVRARIHRWGHISDSEKWWLLEHAQVVLYPSILEGFGMVPFEAAAVKTPCLAFDGTAPGELLTSTAALIASWDPSVWANRVAHLVTDRAASDTVVAEIDEIAERHTWQRCAERTWIAIDHALAAPKRMRHSEDGAQLSRVAAAADRRRPAATLRFGFARGVPAIRRRLTAAWARVTKLAGR